MYRQRIKEYIRAGINYINKPDFLLAYIIARKELITTNIIRSGFIAIGLVPYDPERVLSKLNTQLRTPIPPPIVLPEQGRWVPETPHNTF